MPRYYVYTTMCIGIEILRALQCLGTYLDPWAAILAPRGTLRLPCLLSWPQGPMKQKSTLFLLHKGVAELAISPVSDHAADQLQMPVLVLPHRGQVHPPAAIPSSTCAPCLYQRSSKPGHIRCTTHITWHLATPCACPCKVMPQAKYSVKASLTHGQPQQSPQKSPAGPTSWSTHCSVCVPGGHLFLAPSNCASGSRLQAGIHML